MNANKYLRFGAQLDNVHPEDSIRRFVVFLSLADGQIKIYEPPIRNSGIRGGQFLKSQMVVRPGCDPKLPTYYGARDFHIGATLIIHAHRFRITSADLMVYRYMQQHAEMFAPAAIDGVRNYCLINGDLASDVRCALEEECREYRRTQQAQQPAEPVDAMEQCLRDVHLYRPEDEAPPPLAAEPAVDRERKTGTVAPEDCQYHVMSGDMAAIEAERRSDELRRAQEAISPVYYASGRCANAGEECGKETTARAKSVRFEGAAKCAHNVSTGNCLTCSP